MKEISKLYKEMTSSEKGTLAFNLAIKDDHTEMVLVSATVERHTYLIKDYAYTNRVNNLFTIQLLFCSEFWRLVALKNELHVGLVAGRYDELSVDRIEFINSVLDRFSEYESSLIALDDALDKFCIEQGVDVEAIRRCTIGTLFEPLEPDTEMSIEMRDSYLEMFKKIADS